MEMLIAWLVVAVAGLATLAGIFMLTRSIETLWLRSLLRCLATVWLLVPSPIVAVDGYYAPAYVVAIFEGLLRPDGNPKPALFVLALASVAVVIVFLIAGAVRWARAPKAT
jgi:hypothetical protein